MKKFRRVFEGIAKAGQSTDLNDFYTELFITERVSGEVNKEHEVRLIETASRKPAKEETPIKLEDIFKPLPGQDQPSRTIMTTGVAGIGKTILTHKFTLDWAEGKANHDIHFTLPFTFRELNLLKEKEFSLMELLHHFFIQTKGIRRYDRFQVVFILDGLDECRLPLDFQNNPIWTDVTKSTSVDILLTNLIMGDLLPSARIWITTRPAAANQIPAECVGMVTEFITFLEETNADHQDLLYHSRVRWLSLGKVFQRVWELKDEIRSFFNLMGKSEEFPELSDTNWLCDFAFAVDIFSHMNELNVKLQGKDQFAHDMYTNVRAFKSKLVLFSRQMSNKSFAHFPTLAVQKEAARNAKKYCKSLDDLHREFCRRFCDFEKIDKSLQLVSCPLSQDPESAPQELQLELIDLQSDSVSKEKFKSLKLNDFYASLNETAFPNLRRTAQKMLVLFGSTYVCKKNNPDALWEVNNLGAVEKYEILPIS
ncbi:hypothetical protein NHX12_000480 [Muraenolepis orangiensis]|uniref:NACHT domain-containing protein n=1 Tax=Muraenolepis orangiensis TaxID=630683 RepID=A0A9Q0D5Y2_9TELE|nr:hypothetical protein NHX12_000480 [Muraenolepis orangiensis]